jgi:hypothetical protein
MRPAPHFEFLARLDDAVLAFLARDPLGQFGQALAEVLAGRIAQALARLGQVGDAVADVAGAALAGDLRLQVRPAHRRGLQAGHLLDRAVLAAGDVEHLAVGGGFSSASMKARAMSRTWTKSRRCWPSSKIIGAWPLAIREAKIASTPV